MLHQKNKAMKQFNRPTDNMGGLLKIWAVPPGEITISGNVVSFTTTSNIVQLNCSQGSMEFTEKTTRERAGTVYLSELNAFAPKDSKEANELISDMNQQRWVVIYLDQNEQYKVVGIPTNPLRVAFDLGTGQDTRDRNGHSVKFYGKLLKKAIFVDNPFTT